MNRRAVIGMVGSGVLSSGAGCSTFGSNSDTVEETQPIDPASSGLSAAEFRAFATESVDRYGSGGVWGRTRSEPEHELEFQGAWTATAEHRDGVDSDHVAAMYRLPPTPDGTASSQVWLWSGVDPTESGTVRRIETEVSIPGDEAALGIYSPAQDFDASVVDSYTVEAIRKDVVSLSTTMPLSRGTVSVGERTQIGEGGAYQPLWKGTQDDTQSLAATTELRWESDVKPLLDWSVSVETTA